MRVSLALGIVAAGSAIMLTGCGAGTNTPAGTSVAIPSQAASPIPRVEKTPRDVNAVAQRPCELLTTQQARSFGLGLPPEQRDGLFGTQRCGWTSTNREREIARTVGISMFTNNLTLEAVYDRRQRLPFFELTNIDGYPATVSRTNASEAICNIDVKPAEHQSVSITYYAREFDSNPQQSCEPAKQIAAAVLMNLPPKS